MLKETLIATAFAALLAVPAFAQTRPAAQTPDAAASSASSTAAGTSTVQKPGFMRNQSENEWRSSHLIGASVYGPGDSSIGEVNDVLVGRSGNVRAVVIGVGGFLGVGQKNVAVPFSALNIKRNRSTGAISKIAVTYSKQQLKQAPHFAYYEAGRKQTTGSDTGSSSGASQK